MSAQLQKVQDKQAALSKSIGDYFDRDELDIIKTSYAKGATDEEFFSFIKVCSLRKLNPFAKEIYFVKRQSKHGPVVAHQVGIDGWRKMAATHPDWAGPGTVRVYDWTDKPYRHPQRATATYYRIIRGERTEITSEIFWDEFYPGEREGFMWRSKPAHMLKKCAEGQAIRLAFPEVVGGIELPEETESIKLSDDKTVEESKNNVEQIYGGKPKDDAKALPTVSNAPADDPADGPEIPSSEVLDGEVVNPELFPDEEEEAAISPVEEIRLNTELINRMIRLSDGEYDRDSILTTFGKKSIAELRARERERMQAWIAKAESNA